MTIGHQPATEVVTIVLTLMIAESFAAPPTATRIKRFSREIVIVLKITPPTTTRAIIRDISTSSTKELVDTSKDITRTEINCIEITSMADTSMEVTSTETATGMMYRIYPRLALATTPTIDQVTLHPRKSRDTNT